MAALSVVRGRFAQSTPLRLISGPNSFRAAEEAALAPGNLTSALACFRRLQAKTQVFLSGEFD
jgi:hypothetical protein